MITAIKPQSTFTNFKAYKPSPVDLEYKKLLQKGLKDTFEITCKIRDLDSIAGPDELKEIISKLKPHQYKIGKNFRANFHLHTRASDGSMTPENFLEQCAAWANKIFEAGNANDDLPPFSAAITDHDRIASVKQALAIIAQNPETYKNFKFITGCEFLFNGYEGEPKAFEAVGLGFNPFDKNLEHMMRGFSSNNQISDIKKVKDAGGVLSLAHPIISRSCLTEDFFKFLKDNGVDGAEGNYQYLGFKKDYIAKMKPIVDKLIKDFNMFVTGGTDSHHEDIFGR